MADMKTEHGNTLLLESEFLELLKEKRGEKPLKAFCAELGNPVSHQYLSEVLNGTYHPGAKLAEALGYSQIFAFIPGVSSGNGAGKGKSKPAKKAKAKAGKKRPAKKKSK